VKREFGSFKILPVTQITQRQTIGGLITNEMKRLGVVEVACFKELGWKDRGKLRTSLRIVRVLAEIETRYLLNKSQLVPARSRILGKLIFDT
jgi:hypothetical protein